MMIETVVTIANGSVKSDAGIHGSDIGMYLSGVTMEIDTATLHDGWVKIVGPKGLAPWKATKKSAWIELAHTSKVNTAERRFLVIVPQEGDIKVQRIL